MNIGDKKEIVIKHYQEVSEYFIRNKWDIDKVINKAINISADKMANYRCKVYKTDDVKNLKDYPIYNYIYEILSKVYELGWKYISAFYNPFLYEMQFSVSPNKNFLKGSMSINVQDIDNENYQLKYSIFNSKGNSIKENKFELKYNNEKFNLNNIVDTIKKLNSESSDKKGKIYYTKCGKTFKKNTTSTTTGYEYDREDIECKSCPFAEVVSRYRNNELVKIYECRAGEKEPNRKNEYSKTNLQDYNNLSIYSLDWNWLEELRKDIETMPGVESAYYNQDLSDCRKVLGIGFKKNRLGIQTKQLIVKAYFK